MFKNLNEKMPLLSIHHKISTKTYFSLAPLLHGELEMGEIVISRTKC